MSILDKFKKSSDQKTAKVTNNPADDSSVAKNASEQSVAKPVRLPKKEKENEIKTSDSTMEKERLAKIGILLRPFVTEKSTALGTVNQYVFEVEVKANKIAIARAVQDKYGVKPIAVNVIKRPGKKVRYGRSFGQRRIWKKAIITLPAGKSIKINEV